VSTRAKQLEAMQILVASGTRAQQVICILEHERVVPTGDELDENLVTAQPDLSRGAAVVPRATKFFRSLTKVRLTTCRYTLGRRAGSCILPQ